MLDGIKDFFGWKKWKKKKPIKKEINKLPEIDAWKPLVVSDEDEMKNSKVNSKIVLGQEKILRSCSVCKFAKHDNNLGETKEVICILDPNKPVLKPGDDTCLKHELKYKNLKVIIDKGTLLEYDSDKASSREPSGFLGRETKGVKEIGEEEWQQ